MSLLAALLVGIIISGLVYAYHAKANLTMTLVLVNAAVFVPLFILARAGGGEAVIQTYLELGFRGRYLIGEGVWWSPFTLFSSIFIHAGPWHLMVNMIILLLIGVPFEERVKRRAFALVYFGGGMGGSLIYGALSLLGPASSLLDPAVLGVGASGAIFAVMGGFVRLYPRDEIPMLLIFIFLQRVPVYVAVLLFAALQTLQVFSIRSGLAEADNVGYIVHLTSFFAGVVLAPLAVSTDYGQRRRLSKLDLTLLEPLARSQGLAYELKSLLAADEPELERVWTEELFKKLKCPDCRLNLGPPKGGSLTCSCGYSFSLSRNDSKGS